MQRIHHQHSATTVNRSPAATPSATASVDQVTAVVIGVIVVFVVLGLVAIAYIVQQCVASRRRAAAAAAADDPAVVIAAAGDEVAGDEVGQGSSSSSLVMRAGDKLSHRVPLSALSTPSTSLRPLPPIRSLSSASSSSSSRRRNLSPRAALLEAALRRQAEAQAAEAAAAAAAAAARSVATAPAAAVAEGRGDDGDAHALRCRRVSEIDAAGAFVSFRSVDDAEQSFVAASQHSTISLPLFAPIAAVGVPTDDIQISSRSSSHRDLRRNGSFSDTGSSSSSSSSDSTTSSSSRRQRAAYDRPLVERFDSTLRTVSAPQAVASVAAAGGDASASNSTSDVSSGGGGAEVRKLLRLEPGARSSLGLVRASTDNDISKAVAAARRSGEFGPDDLSQTDEAGGAQDPLSGKSSFRSPRMQRRQSLPRSLLAYAQASAAMHELRARTVLSPEHRASVDMVNGRASAHDAMRKRPSVYDESGGFSWDGTLGLLAQLAELKKTNLELERSSIELLEEVGHGAFARVYMASYEAPGADLAEIVAVKELLVESGTQTSVGGGGGGDYDSERRVFMHEMELMRKLTPHENVVQLIGVVLSHPQWIVTEFCAGGALLGYLRDLRARDMRLGRRQTIEMMLQTACGVLHLHQQHIVHRDIAARNMLLAHNGVIKVADFGLSRNTLEDGYHTKSRTGPIRWMSVESMVQKAYSTRSDIWSFGVLMWEIETRGLTPYFHIRNQIDLVMQIVRDKVRLPAPAGCPLVLVHLMNRCWNEVPTNRPDMGSIVSLLRSLKDEYHADYIETDANKAQLSAGDTSSTMDSFALAPQRPYDEIANGPPGARPTQAATSQLARTTTTFQGDDGSTYYFDEVINAQLDRLRSTASSSLTRDTATSETAAVANKLAAMFLQTNAADAGAAVAPGQFEDDDDVVIVAPKRVVDEFVQVSSSSS